MPRVPLHALIWSTDRTCYELFTHGQPVQCFRPGDDEPWLAWLGAQTAFAFHGRCGRLNVHNEPRTRTTRYWYAYHATDKRSLKRYLGKTANLTLVRLEQVAKALSSQPSPAALAPAQPARETLAQPHTASPHTSQPLEQLGLLLSTKLAYPRVPAGLVVRERLLQDLDAALSHRLTLLSASAGWGKTTLLSAWASRQLHPVAWVSLDELDNDLTRFWVALIAALRTCVPTFGAGALAMLQLPEPAPLSAVLSVLLNDLASVAEPAPILLILDDYHLINDQAIQESVTFVLEHLPDQLHLVLSSRIDPDLPLARWRLQGELLEIRTADLRFTTAEAIAFLIQALGDVLPEADMRLLERRTDGWIAGLQLAVLAMRQHADRSAFVQLFTGSHPYLADYVQEEILARQPLPVQRFLLYTAVLSRMNAALCTTLTDDSTSQAMLEWLERNNLFVVPLDEQRQWYRLHDLFREVLLARLHATEPELVPRLHQRAALWYAAQNELREAIAHALAAANFSYAAALMERAAEELWLTGESATLYRWVTALPDAVVRAHARLVLTAALYLLNSAASSGAPQRVKARTQAEQMMVRVEAALRQQADVAALPETETALLHQRLRLLRGWYVLFEARAKGDLDQLHSIWQQMQHLAIEDDVLWQMIPLYVTVMLREWLLHEGSLVIPLQEAKQRAIQSGDRFATLRVMQWLAMILLSIGQLRQVHQECVAALDLLQQIGGHAALGGYCRFFLAQVLFQWNELDTARTMLRQTIRDALAWQQIELQILGYLGLAEVELNAANLVEAQQALQEAEQLVRYHGFASYLPWLESIRVLGWLAKGDLATAGDWAEQVVFNPDAWKPNCLREFALLVLLHLVQHQYTRALDTLERFSIHLDQPENIDTTIQFLALHVIALHYSGKPKQAREVIARLLALSEAEGYIRVYLEKGELMRQVLQSFLCAPRDQVDSLPPTSIAFARKLLALFEQGTHDARTPSLRLPQALGLHEPLTPREQEVLRLLLTGASNQAIAAQLVISLATVKKHVSNLLGKLGVESRTQAIARARDWSHLA